MNDKTTFANDKDAIIRYAQIYAYINQNKQISADDIWLSVMYYVDKHDFSDIFWECMGLADASILYDCFATDLQKLDDNISTNTTISDVDIGDRSLVMEPNIVTMLYIATRDISHQYKEILRKYKISIRSIRANSNRWESKLRKSKLTTKVFFGLINTICRQMSINSKDLMSIDIELSDVVHISNNGDISKDMTGMLSKLVDAHISNEVDLEDRGSDVGDNHKSQVSTENPKEVKKMAVEYFGNDLTQEAIDGAMDPVIGRSMEIDHLIYTLLRKTKSNPMLIGEAGVGKTAIVEGLAQKIAKGDVPQRLIGKKIFSIDVGALVAGTKYRGEFEARLKSILDEAKDPSNNIILFIDEIHSIIGLGSSDGTNDGSQLIKPLLARGQIKLIGATTYDEYQKHIEKDQALKRRFQEISVSEPSDMDTSDIIHGLKTKYEDYHGVTISEEAISQSILLSRRYIMNKQLPDKALDLIDEACARKSTIVTKLQNNDDYKKLEQELDDIQSNIEKAVESQDYFLAADLKAQKEQIKDKINKLKMNNTLPHHLRPIVELSDIGEVLAHKMGLPSDVVTETEIQKLKRLKKDLNDKIIGQDEASQAILQTIQKSRLSPISRNKPIASFIFLGPSGVGKTYIAKTIASDYFGDPKALIRVDMSEMMEKHSISKLIGSPAGYVGYEEGGGLTEQVRRRPYSVILFDEIEKADPAILNILLQILDEGQIKDNKGRIIDFKSTIIIMTSNIGSEFFSKKGNTIGFSLGDQAHGDFANRENTKAKVLDKLKDTILPEILNRIDHKIVFRPLSHEHLENIFVTQREDFVSMWGSHPDAKIPKYTNKQIKAIINEIYDPAYGARVVERKIHEIEHVIIDQMMQ